MLPEKVTVAGIDYEVAEVETVIIGSNSDYAGSVSYSNGKIELLKELPKTRKEQVLVHEMLHAVFYEAGYEEHEEEMISRLGVVLYQVLKDNKLYFGSADIAER